MNLDRPTEPTACIFHHNIKYLICIFFTASGHISTQMFFPFFVHCKKCHKKEASLFFSVVTYKWALFRVLRPNWGFLSGLRVVWKLVSLDPWPRPSESQCVSFYGNGEIVTTSQQRPAACRLLNRAHLQKTEGPSEMGSDPSSDWLSHIWSYIDTELA